MKKKKIIVDESTGEIIKEPDVELRATAHVRTHFNYQLGEFDGDLEHPSGVKLTTPGMAVTLEELIDRFVPIL